MHRVIIICLIDPVCMIDRYQIGVSVSCNSPTDHTNSCLNVDHLYKHFIMAFFFLVVAVSDSVNFQMLPLKISFHH